MNNSAAFATLLGKILPKEIEAGVQVRHTLEDFIMASFKQRKARGAREAMADHVETSQAHAAQSAPQSEQRADLEPPSAVINGRSEVSPGGKAEDPDGLIPAQPGLSLQALVLGSMPRRDY